jgi:hypothetical protein
MNVKWSSTTGGRIPPNERRSSASAGRLCAPLCLLVLLMVAIASADARTIRVPVDAATIQAAVDTSVDGDTISILPGTYTGNGNRDIDLTGKQVLVTGAGAADNVIIDVQSSGHPGFYCFPTSGDSVYVAIANLTIRSATSGVCSYLPELGLQLRNLRLIGNQRGLEVANGRCSGSLFQNNTVGIEAVLGYAGPTPCQIRECRFEGNTTAAFGDFQMYDSEVFGGTYGVRGTAEGWGTSYSVASTRFAGITGIVLSGAIYVTVSHCTIEGNPGDVLWALSPEYYPSHVTLADCIIRENGGGLYLGMSSESWDNYFTMTRCQVTGNSDGVVYECHRRGSCVIANCTISANGFSAVEIVDGTASLSNTIMSGNARYGLLRIAPVAECGVVCCDAYDNGLANYGGLPDPTGQNGNISLDPLFCDPEMGYYALQEGSPCAPHTPPNPNCDLIGVWGVGCGISGVQVATAARADKGLELVGPNPFRHLVRFQCRGGSARPTAATLSIHDASGRLIRTLWRSQDAAGVGAWEWDGRDDAGQRCPAGVYFAALSEGATVSGIPVVLLNR